MKVTNALFLSTISIAMVLRVSAQQYSWVSSSNNSYWKSKNTKLQTSRNTPPDLSVDDKNLISTFQAWGTCFNELGWDALNILPAAQRDTIFKQLFSPDGDLRYTMGRFAMNANDYARGWYSCDSIAGDFDLKHFNIERDKTTLIPYIKEAQRQNPNLSFWISPWSPPSWMKVNNNYAVRSNAKYNQLSPLSDLLLYENSKEINKKVFPQQLAVNDYLIQDPRYLKSYANYFCKFIDVYKEQGIPIKTVMYQNEAYSYTIYPGCAWTAEGSIRFNAEYLAPALKAKHPEVSLYLGTINSNRYDVVDQILSDPRMPNTIQGVGFQWEGGQILPAIRKKYPNYTYVQTESECGWGTFDWKSAEHTFELINHYLSNGCTEYTFWNVILTDNGTSPWGWKQNALIQVNSKEKTAIYAPEYYAVKHYNHYVSPGSKLIATKEVGDDKKPILVFLTPQGRHVVIAGNFKDESQRLVVKIGTRVLDVMMEAHSLNTFESK